MINIDKYENVLNQGLLLDHYSLLCCIRDGGELPKSKRIQGFINLLHKKGYLLGGVITKSGLELIDKDTVMCQSTTEVSVQTNTKGLIKTITPTNDYMTWARALHEKLQDRLFEKTGKRQARGAIQGTTYSFLPNASDFCKILLKVIVLHKLKDFNKIDKCLMRYVDRKIREGNWFPILGYYIIKNGMSQMITDMDSMEDDENEVNNDSIINI